MAGPGQKVVLITGCSSGIGLRMAVMLAKDEQKRYHGESNRQCACARGRPIGVHARVDKIIVKGYNYLIQYFTDQITLNATLSSAALKLGKKP